MRDPSHVRALAVEELTNLYNEAGLQTEKSQFYKHEYGVEDIIQRSFPNPGDADRIRQMYAEDLGVDRLGVGVHRKDGKLCFAFPVVILVAQKPKG